MSPSDPHRPAARPAPRLLHLRGKTQLTPNLLRLSIGIEDIGDLLNDIEEALDVGGSR